MKAQILSTGDELILGHIVDSNASFLARELQSLGIRLEQIHAVGDDLTQIAALIQKLSKTADLVLVTGGLGPTSDDVTTEAAAAACNDVLVRNETAFASMEAYFQKRGFVITKANEKQALLPSRAGVLVNEHGTAPGFSIVLNHCLFFFMPGVPSEMEQMFTLRVKPEIRCYFNITDQIAVDKISVFGLPESRVSDLLSGFDKKFDGMKLGFRAVFPIIEVKIMHYNAGGASMGGKEQSADMMKTAKAWVVSKLENKVFSDTGLSLAQELGKVLTQKKMTLAVAESCTGGLISNMITDVPGSSDYFLLSATTYSNDAKIKVLGVNEQTLIKYGAVHETTALEMARGVQKKAGASVAVSTTGVAGPGGGSDEKPVGTVCIGVSGPGVEISRRYRFKFDDRFQNKQMFAATAINLLLKAVRSTGMNESRL